MSEFVDAEVTAAYSRQTCVNEWAIVVGTVLGMDFNESSAAPTYLSVGQRYELLEQIGAGSFGEVYRALDHESEGGAKTVALKKIRPRTSASIAGKEVG